MKKGILLSIVSFFTFSLVFISCKKDNADDNITPVSLGYVSGKVLAQNGTTPIRNANIFIDFNGEIYITLSTLDGTFTLQAPAGQQVLNIQSGSGRIFRGQYNVTINPNETTIVPNGILKLTQAENLAYIYGMFDNIQTIIIDSLGYTADEITVADLSSLSTLQNYGAIFLNCGKSGALDSLKYQNLLTFVEGGGCIYASDWAVEYLTGDGNFKSLGNSHEPYGMKSSCAYGLAGGFIEDSTLCTQKLGPSTMLTDVEIVAQDLIDYLGTSSIDIQYDLGGWEVIELIDLPWEILIQDNTTYGPLAARIYMNILNKSAKDLLDNEWITICHIPPGNPSNPQTITISVNALPAHLAHGDFIGSCESQGNGGVIYFTTFHNEVQGNISSDVQHILQYFILNM